MSHAAAVIAARVTAANRAGPQSVQCRLKIRFNNAVVTTTSIASKAIAGTPEMVVARLKQLRDEAHLAGVSAEINPGSMLSHAQVMESLRLYIQEVMPHFK